MHKLCTLLFFSFLFLNISNINANHHEKKFYLCPSRLHFEPNGIFFSKDSGHLLRIPQIGSDSKGYYITASLVTYIARCKNCHYSYGNRIPSVCENCGTSAGYYIEDISDGYDRG